MPIDEAAALAYAFAPVVVTVERGRLAFFAQATGQDDPVYRDVAAARAAGHPDLPVPPTFFFGLELAVPGPFAYVTDLGADLRQVLHGKQSFRYDRLAYAGDTLTLQARITSVVSRPGRALEFLVKQTSISRDDEPIAEASSTIVIRQLAGVPS